MPDDRTVDCKSAERALIGAMLNGNEAAFREFFDGYFPRVYGFALRRLHGDVDAAKEVVQSTLIKAVRGLARFRVEATLFSWLCQICRRQIVDYLRTRTRHAKHVERIDDSVQLRSVIDCIEAPAEDEPLPRYDAAQTRRLVGFVLDGLPAHYADALSWKYIEGRSVAEIGERLGIGQIAAQSILARARVAFRAALGTVGGFTAKDMLASDDSVERS